MNIPKHLKASVNRLVHRAAIDYETRTKAMLIQQIEAMRSAGATDEELTAHLAVWQPAESPDVQ